MTAERLPEELVHEVLRHCIVASPDDFLDPAHFREHFHEKDSTPSPLGKTNLLLVSKRWLRIGTPLLYTSLWLSNPSHIEAVTRVFQSNPHLGRHVLDLRLEGGFGEELFELLSHTPDAQNINFGCNISPSDDVTGLVKILPLLSPQALYLGYLRCNGEDRRKLLEIGGLLEECISRKWLSLRHIHIPYWFNLRRSTAQAIQNARFLRTLNVHSEDVFNWSWSADLLCFLENSSLQTVYCRSAVPPDNARRFMSGQGVRKRIVDSLTFVQHVPELGVDNP